MYNDLRCLITVERNNDEDEDDDSNNNTCFVHCNNKVLKHE